MTDEERVVRRFKRMKLLVATLVVAGLFVQTIGNAFVRAAGVASPVVVTLVHTGGLLFQVLACVLYMRLKGRNGMLGLLGILGLIGVACVFFMDKQCLRCRTRHKHDDKACRACGWPS
jgi:hypothetical protein